MIAGSFSLKTSIEFAPLKKEDRPYMVNERERVCFFKMHSFLQAAFVRHLADYGVLKGGQMEVTEIRIFLADEDRLKAYVTVTFDNCFVVRDLKVIYGNNGLFVAMPSKKKKDGTYKDIAHPINADFRNYLESLILEKYNDEAKQITAGFPVKKATDGDYDDAIDSTAPVLPPAATPLERRRDFEVGIGPRGEEKE